MSGISPHDRFTWLLEVAPILVALPILVATYRRFPLTPLASFALIGALIAQPALSRLQNRQLARLGVAQA